MWYSYASKSPTLLRSREVLHRSPNILQKLRHHKNTFQLVIHITYFTNQETKWSVYCRVCNALHIGVYLCYYHGSEFGCGEQPLPIWVQLLQAGHGVVKTFSTYFHENIENSKTLNFTLSISQKNARFKQMQTIGFH